eukprot:1572978-Rhodomonas_salina.1
MPSDRAKQNLLTMIGGNVFSFQNDQLIRFERSTGPIPESSAALARTECIAPASITASTTR